MNKFNRGPGRRVKVFEITGRDIFGLFMTGSRWEWETVHGIPPTARVTLLDVDQPRDVLRVLIEDDSYEPVPDGCVPGPLRVEIDTNLKPKRKTTAESDATVEHFWIAGLCFGVQATGLCGADSGRMRYKVDCGSCGIVHEATTGPGHVIRGHLENSHPKEVEMIDRADFLKRCDAIKPHHG